MDPWFRITLDADTSLRAGGRSRAARPGHAAERMIPSLACGSFLAEKQMRAATACDLPSCRTFHVFHHSSRPERLKCP
jgi:hypothetical protein